MSECSLQQLKAWPSRAFCWTGSMPTLNPLGGAPWEYSTSIALCISAEQVLTVSSPFLYLSFVWMDSKGLKFCSFHLRIPRVQQHTAGQRAANGSTQDSSFCHSFLSYLFSFALSIALGALFFSWLVFGFCFGGLVGYGSVFALFILCPEVSPVVFPQRFTNFKHGCAIFWHRGTASTPTNFMFKNDAFKLQNPL